MDYTQLKNPDLAAECERRGLPRSGNRTALLARLAAHDEARSRAPIPNEQEPNMVDIAAGPDGGADNGDDLLNAVNPQTPEPAAPAVPQLDPRDQRILDLQAELLQVQAAQAAKPGTRPTGGDVADLGVIAAANNREQVYRAEFPMMSGMELSDGIHESFIRQCADKAVAAGFRTRGGAHRVAWGVQDGQRTAVYEIYVRQ